MAQNKKERFLDALNDRILILDGAMGTRLMDQGVSIGSGLDSANLDAPGVVQAVHRDYVAAGADILQTNTFGANHFRLSKHGLSAKVRRINRQGAMLAKGVAGPEHFVAGSMGPVGKPIAPIGKIAEEEAFNAFKEQSEALLDADVDLIILETFTDLHEARIALKAVLSVAPDMPVIGMMTFTDEGKTIYGFKPEECARELMKDGAVAIGANCSSGPAHLHEVVDRMNRVDDVIIFVSPNAGLPAFIDGRYVYLTGPDYFAKQAKQFVAQGVRGFGGCCGTGPEHIRAIQAAVGTEKPVFGEARVSTDVSIEFEGEKDETRTRTESIEFTSIEEKIASGKFVVSVEIDPPKSISPDKMIQGAALLKQAGVDAINVADSPLARARMSPLALSILIRQEVDIEIILHMSCRDRNVLGLQAELMGSHALGIRNILAVTGDPPSMGDCPDATGVFDVDAIGLLSVIRHLNEGTDLVGKPLKFNTHFFGGCASNPTSEDLEREIRRFKEKKAEGVQFTMTQPLYEAESLERFLEATKCDIPVLVGILPLRNFRHANFLHNEVPGMDVPIEIRERMKAAGEDGPKEGVAIAREYLERVRPMVQGVYLMPPFNRFEMAVDVIDGIV